MSPFVLQIITFVFTLLSLFMAVRAWQQSLREGEQASPRQGMGTLFLVSMTSLYLELVIIRWIGTEIRIFAFVQNLVLIACFLGFGVGCFTSAKRSSLLPGMSTLAVLGAIVCLPIKAWQQSLLYYSNLLTISSDSALWGGAKIVSPLPQPVLALGAMAMVALMLWLIAMSMIPLGRWIGQCFDNADNVIRAYTVDLAGSLVGSWLLLLLSVLTLPPAAWVVVAFALVLFALRSSSKELKIGGILAISVIGMVFFNGLYRDDTWSPYQKLSLVKISEKEHVVMVNSTGYMSMADTSAEALKANPDYAKNLKNSVYDSPFRFAPNAKDVLVVGAGAGNDASAALRNGATHVDAVEIDPVIYRFGKALHPDHPYDSDKVNVIINDARNYLRTTDKKYDVIVFGLLDSHTEISGYTNMRVDNYVYTKESFAQARKLLNPEGILVLKFEVRHPWEWIGQRFYRELAEVFGRDPVSYRSMPVGNLWQGSIYIESDGKQMWERAASPEMQAFLGKYKPNFDISLKNAPESSTDDWPYPYNFGRTIPQTYLTVAVILMGLAYCMVRRVVTLKEPQTWPMFALGGGFMLMETQMINRLTLYFGTTWVVNSIVISIILCTLVLANFYVIWRKQQTGSAVYPAILVLSLILNYLYPWETLPYAPWVVGAMLSCAYAVAIFMAGVIFVSTLAKAEKPSAALGSNIMGSVVGGLSQNLSFIFGLKALLPLAALFYAGYFVAVKRVAK